MPTLSIQIAAVAGQSEQQSVTDTLANTRAPANTGLIDNGIVDGSGPTVMQPGEHAAANGCYSIALRFPGITIAQGTTITSATLTVYGGNTYNSTTGNATHFITMWVSTQAADNAAALVTTAGDLRSSVRARSTAVDTFDLHSVTLNSAITLTVTDIVQEIINRAGFVSGNAIVIIMDTKGAPNTGSGNTAPSEWNDFQAYTATQSTTAPKLDIVYGAASTFPPLPAVWHNPLIPQ